MLFLTTLSVDYFREGIACSIQLAIGNPQFAAIAIQLFLALSSTDSSSLIFIDLYFQQYTLSYSNTRVSLLPTHVHENSSISLLFALNH